MELTYLTNYVPKHLNKTIDKEAALRATTVYLVDKRIDMVPDLLSSNLCSLRGNEERFAFSCIWEITRDANIVNTKFHKSIIRSRQAMTYEEAQLKIDDSSQDDELSKSLRSLNSLAKILKRRRIDNGQVALVLASPEIRFQVDSETHDPIEVESKKLRDTNSMVEEFMLLANISVAKKILEEFPECALLRRHPTPPISNFEPIIKAGKKLGFDININSGKELAESLDAAVRPDNPYFNTMLRILATRCMLQAVYFASGMMQKDEYTLISLHPLGGKHLFLNHLREWQTFYQNSVYFHVISIITLEFIYNLVHFCNKFVSILDMQM
uniref:RNB domain-containing protein n=1 Tax=Timema cristinae TaxID=61476 RepID=A0A7R9H3L5_TIMCR|nr:unnamed protein product [Timema cristinae]